MKNYAEELAYWYLRFNGFFLLNDYVSHPHDTNTHSHSDTDLLAVRMPFTREIVGDHHEADRCPILSELLNHQNNPNRIIGIICEVKGGQRVFHINRNNGGKFRSQLKKLGFLPEGDIEIVFNWFRNHSFYQNDFYRIQRIVICRQDNHSVIPINWNRINIESIIDFIINNRFAHHQEKFGGWDKFDSTIIQFLLRHRNLLQIAH